MLPWANYRMGNPENPSYVSNVLLPYAGVMSFNQRFINTLYYIYTATIDKYNNFLVTALNRKHFGNGIPPAEEIHRRTALVFVNSHVAIDEPRPFVPNIVEIGGIHLPPVKPLPKVNNYVIYLVTKYYTYTVFPFKKLLSPKIIEICTILGISNCKLNYSN